MAKSNKNAEEKTAKATTEKKTKKADKNKKPNWLVRVGKKIKETFMELKRVTWPTFPQALKATGVVIGIVAIFLIITTGVNYGLSALLQLLTEAGDSSSSAAGGMSVLLQLLSNLG